MRPARRRARRSVPIVVATAAALLAACDGDDATEAEGTAADVPIVGTVAVPEERLSPFCQAMIDLGDQLLDDPPDDVNELVIATYEDIADEVPDEIRADFDAVLAVLRGEIPPPTTADPTAAPEPSSEGSVPSGPITSPDGSVVDEFIVPPATPAERLNDYVEFTCRDTANNPGPPATSPAVEITDEETDEADDG